MFSASLKGSYSTWTSAAGKTYAVDWDNVFRVFGNNVTSDPNWIIKAMDAGFAYGGPRVQVDTVPAMVTSSTPSTPVSPAPTVQTIFTQQTIPSGTFTTTPLPTRTITTVAPTSTITPVDQGTNIPERWTVYTNQQPAAPAQPQGIPMSEFNFSTLPQIRAHAQLGRLGDPSGCSIWDPTSYGTCATWIIQARTELADAHNQILDLANGWASAVQEIQYWPDSDSKQAALTDAQTQLQAATSLVQAHTQVQNDFESKIQPYVNIGLAGLWKDSQGVSGMGILPAWLIIAGGSLIISGLLAWGITSALALKSNYDAQAAYYNQFTSYYQTCRDLAAQGKPCNLPAPSIQGPGAAWGSQGVTWAVLLGLGALVIFNLSRR